MCLFSVNVVMYSNYSIVSSCCLLRNMLGINAFVFCVLSSVASSVVSKSR